MAAPLVLRSRVPSIVRLRNEVKALCVGCGVMVRLRGRALRPHNWRMRLCPGSWQIASPEGAEPAGEGGAA
jgi:hypothetical protein